MSWPEWAVLRFPQGCFREAGLRLPFPFSSGGSAAAPAAGRPAGSAGPSAGAHEPPAPGPALRPDPSGSMGGARDAGWVAAGLLLGAGACYCIYRLTRGQRRGGQGLRLRPSRSAGEASGNRAGGAGVGEEGGRGCPGGRR